MIRVGKNKGGPRAAKAAGIQMGCLLENGLGTCASYNCSVYEPPPEGDGGFLAQRGSALPLPQGLWKHSLEQVLLPLSVAQIKEWSYKEPGGSVLRNNCLFKGNVKEKKDLWAQLRAYSFPKYSLLSNVGMLLALKWEVRGNWGQKPALMWAATWCPWQDWGWGPVWPIFDCCMQKWF